MRVSVKTSVETSVKISVKAAGALPDKHRRGVAALFLPRGRAAQTHVQTVP